MAVVPRMELTEIYFKYKHHPTIVDLYVEGEFDRDVLNQLFRELKLSAYIGVFTADEVNMPDEVVAGMKLRVGSNKHRLIALATLLNSELAGISASVTCLVDADQDRVLGVIRNVSHLAYTTHTCIEMQCLSAVALHKFLAVTANCTNEEITAFVEIAEAVLPVQFCLRALNERLQLGATMPLVARATKRVLRTFSPTAYCDLFVASNSLWARQAEISGELGELLAILPPDLRDKAHGHDFIELLFAFLNEAGRLKLQSGAQVTDYGGRLAMSCVSAEQLSADPNHSRVLAAARGGPPIWPKTATA